MTAGKGTRGGRLSECLQLTNTYLSTKLKVVGNVETQIRSRKVFGPVWPDPVKHNPVATKAMLQAEYGTREKRAEKLRINLSISYVLVLGK